MFIKNVLVCMCEQASGQLLICIGTVYDVSLSHESYFLTIIFIVWTFWAKVRIFDQLFRILQMILWWKHPTWGAFVNKCRPNIKTWQIVSTYDIIYTRVYTTTNVYE